VESPEERENMSHNNPKRHNPPMKKKLNITFDRDLDLESDHVLAYMIRTGASLDIDTYIDFCFLGNAPDDILEDGEFLASIPDIVRYGPGRIQ
jgi:hypothetical protein